jgi:hypothetical protein
MAGRDPELDVAAAAMVAETARFVVHGELPNEPIPGLDQ